MTTWNYRVFREKDGDYIIREVFYAEDGAIIGCTENAVEPFGRTLDALSQSIKDFETALRLPVLTLEDIVQSKSSIEQPARSRNITHEQLRARLGLVDTPVPSK